MKNGGQVGSRGYIFQAIIALIECLGRDDWDAIKNEPNTDEDKVDIMLYREDCTILSAIQVKSSINEFERVDVKRWLESLKRDAGKAEKVCLFLVGDYFAPSCKNYIEENRNEIKTVSFTNLQRESTMQLIDYIRNVGLGDRVRISDLELIDANLFSKNLKNSIEKYPVSREEFESAFQRAIPRGMELAEPLTGMVSKEPFVPPCLTSIPPINKETGLVGRDVVVKDIRKMLEEESCIVLVNGLGGIGKTAVMQGVCNELKDEGQHVAWVSCGDSLQDDLLLMRGALGVPKEEKAEEAYRLTKAGIQRLGKSLYLFMDNLSREVSKEERDAINGLGIHVMITSRKENLPFRKKKLEYLEKQDAIKMFYGYYGGESDCDEIVWEIIKSVNCHTLLVELLAKAAREEGGTLDEFYAKLRKEGFFDVSEEEFETEHDDKNLTIEESVIRLYKISRLSEEQRRIMKLFTIFSPEKEIYYKVREWAGFDRKELKKLVNLGWLERGGLENGYLIHQIVRDSIARQLKKDGEKVRLEDYGKFLSQVTDTNGYLGREIRYDMISDRLVLTEDVARFFVEGGREDVSAGTLFNNIAGVYSNQGDYAKALEYYGKALAISERVLGKDHPSTATMYNNIAGVYYSQGNYGKALEYYGKVLAISERVLWKEHPDTAVTYNNIGEVYRAQGDYAKALEYYGKALAIRERVLWKEHPDTATMYNNMALVYDEQADYAKALEYYGKALAIRERVLGPEHPDTATTYNNIAWVYSDQGDYGKSLEYSWKALAIQERLLGQEHPDTAATYNNIAGVYRAQGDYAKALEYYGKTLAISERVLGKEHPSTATTYNNMALVYSEQGDYAKALEYYGKALAISERVLGTEHPYTARTYNNIAGVYSDQGDYGKSLEYSWKALAIQERLLGQEHPDTAATYNNIAVVYRAQGDYAKALEYYRKANAVFLSVLGEEHPYTQVTALSIQIMELLVKTGMTEDEFREMVKKSTPSEE